MEMAHSHDDNEMKIESLSSTLGALNVWPETRMLRNSDELGHTHGCSINVIN